MRNAAIMQNRFLSKTNPEYARAVADSGSVLNSPEINRLAMQIVDLGLWSNLKLWVHSGLVKTRASGSDTFVPKAYDISGNDNDAAQSTTSYQPELLSLGVAFDGSDNYFDCGNDTSLEISTEITVSAWIYMYSFSSGDTGGRLYSKRNNNSSGFEFITQGVGKKVGIVVYNSGGTLITYSSNNSIENLNQWYFVCVSYVFGNGNRPAFYINGQLDGATTNSASGTFVGYNSANVLIGMRYDTARYFNGIINDVRVCNKVFTSTEITAIYNQTKGYYGIS